LIASVDDVIVKKRRAMHQLDGNAELPCLFVEPPAEPRSENDTHRTESFPRDLEEMVRALVDDAPPNGKALNTLFESGHVPTHELRQVGQMRREITEPLRLAHGLKAREHIGARIGSDCRYQ
jgi:hypothetical protein